jgi:hypothetical protein
MTFLSGFPHGKVGMITPRLVQYETIAGPLLLLGTIAIMDLLVLVFGITTTLGEDHPHLLSKGKDLPLQSSEVGILLSQMFPIVATVPLHLLYTTATREDLMTGILRIPSLDLVHLPGLGKIMIEFLLGN